MSYISSYKELVVWQKSMELAKEIYKLTSQFPKTETYGLVLQMRRAAVAIPSIPSNIAEGYGRKSPKKYHQFYSIAYGSALELETQLTLAKELHLTSEEAFIESEEFLKEVAKMLNSMTQKYRRTETRR
jgi:four helix bundle protein